jgi:hypothetical protein
MTADEEELTRSAIDKAYEQQVIKLFGVLCSAGDSDVEAAKRFKLGLDRAIVRRLDAIAAASV